MRRTRKAGLFGALALIAALTVGTVALAGEASQGTVVQRADFEVDGNLSKEKHKNIALTTDLEVTDTSGENKPPAASVSDVLLPKEVEILKPAKKGKKGKKAAKKVPQCNPDSIATANHDTAEETCKKALVGRGDAGAGCAPGPPTIPTEVLAFNGTKQGGKKSLVLHVYANLGGTDQIQVLVGELQKGPAGFGDMLHVDVPPLAGGACSLMTFTVELDKVFKVKGVNVPYISSTCKSELDFGVNFQYADNPQGVESLEPRDTVSC